MKFTCTCRDEKVKVLKAVPELRLEDVVLGQVRRVGLLVLGLTTDIMRH